MYPDLSYLLHDLFGTEVDNWTSIIKTFGLLLAFAFFGAGYLLRVEILRHEKEGNITPRVVEVNKNASVSWWSIMTNLFTVFIFGFKIPYVVTHFSRFQQDPAGVIFSTEGNLMTALIAFFAMGAYFYYIKSKEQAPEMVKTHVYAHDHTSDILILAALSGVAGAKLFSVLENLEDFYHDPMGQVFSGNGLTIYGGLIVAFIVVYGYIKKIGIPPRIMMDIAGMAILLGYAIGRLGCHFSGDGDWGIVAAAQPDWWILPDWLWSYTYPNNVNNDGGLIAACDPTAYQEAVGRIVEVKCQNGCGMRYCHELSQGVYPTSIYETVISLLSLAFLWVWRKRIKVAGMLFFGYMILNGIERFFIEFIRVNPKYNYFGIDLSQAHYISLAFVLVGVMGILYLSRQKQDINFDR